MMLLEKYLKQNEVNAGLENYENYSEHVGWHEAGAVTEATKDVAALPVAAGTGYRSEAAARLRNAVSLVAVRNFSPALHHVFVRTALFGARFAIVLEPIGCATDLAVPPLKEIEWRHGRQIIRVRHFHPS